MMHPRVSIIIPVFNAARLVDIAIQSALEQTYPAIEVVVVDDGSTDDSAVRIRSKQDARLRYVYQANQGQSAAINRGVQESTGDYIKLLDADDWINPEHIAGQMLVLEGQRDCVASCRWGYFLNDFQSPFVRAEVTGCDYDDPLEWVVDSLTKDEGMMGGPLWLIPRSVWDRAGGYDPRLSLNNDFHASIATLLASKGVRFAPDAVYSYRKGVSGALSASYSRKAMESALLTTQLGTALLLERENSGRIRRLAADRFQSWLFQFYPQFPDLANMAEERIRELGGSTVRLKGGRLLEILLPVLGWKGVRQLQTFAYRYGWSGILRRKAQNRLLQLQKNQS
jgi:glycosyltransferase involved in cell wall biosynthesis